MGSSIEFMDVGGYEFLRNVKFLFDDGGLQVFVRRASPAVHRVVDLLGWPIEVATADDPPVTRWRSA